MPFNCASRAVSAEAAGDTSPNSRTALARASAGSTPSATESLARPPAQHPRPPRVAAAGGKTVCIVGGGELAGQFDDVGLLDELFVQVGSVTLGSGKPLLPKAIVAPPLRLLPVRQAGTGFAELHYAGPQVVGGRYVPGSSA